MHSVRGERRRRSDRLFSFLGRSLAIAWLTVGAGSCGGGCNGSTNEGSDAGADAAGAAGTGGSGLGGAGTGGAPTNDGGAGSGGTGGGGTGGAGVAGGSGAGSGGAGSGGAGGRGGGMAGGSGGAGPGGQGGGMAGGSGGAGGVIAALPITAVYSHNNHTCALSSLGTVRCWGDNAQGQLGYGNTNGNIGASSTPASAGDVDVGGKVTQLALGAAHTCALLDNGHVRCWGDAGLYGQLGYGNKNDIGDNEKPASAGDVDIGGVVTQLAAGDNHTCALLDNGHVRCWGLNQNGILGYATTTMIIGDDETPASVGDVNVGGTVIQLAAGRRHTCALLQGGTVRCWGDNFAGNLGYGNGSHVGDDETPASAGDVMVGGVAIGIAVGQLHSCAIIQGGGVRCWGASRKLGYGVALDSDTIGDDEPPSSVVGDVPIGGPVIQLAAADAHTCALLQGGAVRCWGEGNHGQLGYGNPNAIGDNEPVSAAGNVNVGGTVTQITAGTFHTCAVLSGGTVRCWGSGTGGGVGYVNNGAAIGDDETPASVGDVRVY